MTEAMNIETTKAKIPMLAIALAALVTTMTAIMMIAAPSKALAEGELGHSGYVGPHRLQDNPAGAACGNSAIVAVAPLVWANRAYTRGQTVGYQVQVRKTDDLGNTASVYNGPVIKRNAYPNIRANFPNSSIYLPFTYYPQNYAVNIYMYWYNNRGYMQGYSVHRVDNYINQRSSNWVYESYSCRF